MHFIEQLTKKYNGKYSADLTKVFYSPSGKITYQPKKGIIEVDGTKIKIAYNEAGGTMRSTEPVRIILMLDKDYDKKLDIFPSIYFNYITDLIFQPKGLTIPKRLKRQFSFRGNPELLKKLVTDKPFCDALLDENFFLILDDEYPMSLMLTPAYGIMDLAHFEKMILILKKIEFYIKSNNT
jgi:hypothetical protein